MISAYPSLGKDAYENALRYKKFLSKKWNKGKEADKK
jgi:hypothetical protein